MKMLKNTILKLHGAPLRVIMVGQYLARHRGEISRCISEFGMGSGRIGWLQHQAKVREILGDMFRHLITPEEYYLYDFSSLTEKEKDEYVGDIERTIHCARLYNSNRSGRIFMNKQKTYELFEPFFRRELIEVRSSLDHEAFLDFVRRHPTFLVKPSESSRGAGIYQETVTSGSYNKVFQGLLAKAPCVLEELIDQADGMARFHPESVNTIRYATFLTDDGYETIACFVKIGRGSSIVDNGGAGGLLAAVDENTGQVLTAGRSEHDEVYDVHPDTGVRIIGACIPQWHELKDMIAKLVQVLPDQRYVGWDLALSKDGWVLVEGNSGGQFVGPQISLKKGIRPVIARTFGEV